MKPSIYMWWEQQQQQKNLMCASFPISTFGPSFLLVPNLQGEFSQFLYFLDAAALSQWGEKKGGWDVYFGKR